MRRRTWMLAAMCAVVWAAPARAATPVDLGQGDSATVALDPAGTAHIVFKSIESPDGATYCRLPRGARACDIRTFLPLDDPKQGPLIFRRPADGALIVVQSNWEHPPDTLRLGTTWARYSFDNGATWQGPVVLATGSWDVTAAALAVDGQSVFTLYPGAPEGVFFQRAPLAGGGGNVGITLEPPSGDTFGTSNGAELAGLADGRLMETNERHDGVNWRFFTGGDPLNPAAWRGGVVRHGEEPHVATGPRGTYLLEHRSPARQQRGAYRVRSFDTKRARWRAPQFAGADRRIFGKTVFAQDGAGRLHVLTSADYGRFHCLVYARTGTKRSSWFGRTTTLWRTRRFGKAPEGMALAINPDGRGVVVWQDFLATRTHGSVRVLPLRQAHGRYRPIRNMFDRPGCVKN